MIHVIATIEVSQGMRDKLLQEFYALVPQVLEEDGCIEYGPAIDVATDISAQSETRDNAVVVLEKWRDIAALKAHLAAPHMSDYRERVKELIVSVKLDILRPAERST